MPIPILLLALSAFGLTVNRVNHRVEFIHQRQAWVLKTFPGSKPLTAEDLWANCLDGSTACQITPEIEKEQRQESLRAHGSTDVLR